MKYDSPAIEAIFSLIEENSIGEFEVLLKKDPSILFLKHKHMTPATLAAKCGHTNILKLMIEENPEVLAQEDNSGKTPAMYAAEHGHADTLDECNYLRLQALLHSPTLESIEFDDIKSIVDSISAKNQKVQYKIACLWMGIASNQRVAEDPNFESYFTRALHHFRLAGDVGGYYRIRLGMRVLSSKQRENIINKITIAINKINRAVEHAELSSMNLITEASESLQTLHNSKAIPIEQAELATLLDNLYSVCRTVTADLKTKNIYVIQLKQETKKIIQELLTPRASEESKQKTGISFKTYNRFFLESLPQPEIMCKADIYESRRPGLRSLY